MTPRSVVVLAALPVEMDAIAHRLGLARDGAGWHGTHAGRSIRGTAIGMGPARARTGARHAVASHPPSALIVAGIAGGLRPGLRVGAALVPAEVIPEAGGPALLPTALPDDPRLAPAGRLVTVSRAATSRAAKAELHRRLGADAVDMETAAVAETCTALGVPWIAVRAISDDADTELPPELLALSDADGRPRLGAAALYALRHPARIPGLLRLGRDTRVAAAAAAERVARILAALPV